MLPPLLVEPQASLLLVSVSPTKFPASPFPATFNSKQALTVSLHKNHYLWKKLYHIRWHTKCDYIFQFQCFGKDSSTSDNEINETLVRVDQSSRIAKDWWLALWNYLSLDKCRLRFRVYVWSRRERYTT